MKRTPLLGVTLLTLLSANLYAGSGIASLTLDNDYFIHRDDNVDDISSMISSQ